jgi:hypothetical protein
MKNPDANAVYRLLEERMAFPAEPPTLKDFNRCLKIASGSVIARPEANKILTSLLEHHQPNAETMIYVIKNQFKPTHRLLKRDFEKSEKSIQPLIDFIQSYKLLGSWQVQVCLLEHTVKRNL